MYAGTTTEIAIFPGVDSVGSGAGDVTVAGVVKVSSEGNGLRGGTCRYCSSRSDYCYDQDYAESTARMERKARDRKTRSRIGHEGNVRDMLRVAAVRRFGDVDSFSISFDSRHVTIAVGAPASIRQPLVGLTSAIPRSRRTLTIKSWNTSHALIFSINLYSHHYYI